MCIVHYKVEMFSILMDYHIQICYKKKAIKCTGSFAREMRKNARLRI